MLFRSSIGLYPAVFLSSLIFGAQHFANYSVGHQSLEYTSAQMLNAFGFGVLVSGLYLATGNLIVPVLFHALTDLPMELIPYKEFHAQTVGHADWTGTLVTVFLFIVFGLSLIYAYQRNLPEKSPFLSRKGNVGGELYVPKIGRAHV